MDKPELETLSYRPPSAPREVKRISNAVIESKTRVENKEVVSQPTMSKKEAEQTAREYFKTTEQPIEEYHKTMTGRECIGCEIPMSKCPQNEQFIIIKTIQELITCVNNNLSKLPKSKLKSQALEDIDIFKKITLFKLQKEHE